MHYEYRVELFHLREPEEIQNFLAVRDVAGWELVACNIFQDQYIFRRPKKLGTEGKPKQ